VGSHNSASHIAREKCNALYGRPTNVCTICVFSEKPTAHHPTPFDPFRSQTISNSMLRPSPAIVYKTALPRVSLKQPTVAPQPSVGGTAVDQESFVCGALDVVANVVVEAGVKSPISDDRMTLLGLTYGLTVCLSKVPSVVTSKHTTILHLESMR